MDSFTIGLLAGIFIGTVIGMFIVSCLVAGRDEYIDEKEMKKDKKE